MKIERINPYIRRAIRSTLLAGTTIKQRIIFDYELIYVESGAFALRYDGRDYSCREGDFLLLRPGISHKFGGLLVDISQPHIHFDMCYEENSKEVEVCFKDRCQLSREERAMIREDIFRDFPQDPRLQIRDREGFLERFFQIIDPEEAVTPLRKKGLMIELIDRIIADNFTRAEQVEDGEEQRTARMVKEYIDSAYETVITLESLEKQFYYNRYYLERQFLRLYGMPVMAYRNMLRINRAKELLWDHTVTETASMLGYSSIFSFSRAFKAGTGKSPSAYLEEQRAAGK